MQGMFHTEVAIVRGSAIQAQRIHKVAMSAQLHLWHIELMSLVVNEAEEMNRDYCYGKIGYSVAHV